MLPEAREKTTCQGGERVRGEDAGRTGAGSGQRHSPDQLGPLLGKGVSEERVFCRSSYVHQSGGGRPREVERGLWQVPGWGCQHTGLGAKRQLSPTAPMFPRAGTGKCRHSGDPARSRHVPWWDTDCLALTTTLSQGAVFSSSQQEAQIVKQLVTAGRCPRGQGLELTCSDPKASVSVPRCVSIFKWHRPIHKTGMICSIVPPCALGVPRREHRERPCWRTEKQEGEGRVLFQTWSRQEGCPMAGTQGQEAMWSMQKGEEGVAGKSEPHSSSLLCRADLWLAVRVHSFNPGRANHLHSSASSP